jgi:hypothetical protein
LSRLIVDDGKGIFLLDLTRVRITAIVKSDERVAYDFESHATSFDLRMPT